MAMSVFKDMVGKVRFVFRQDTTRRDLIIRRCGR